MSILNETLEQREARIAQALSYINRTKSLFEQYASSELTAAHQEFKPLIKGLQSDKVRLVVIGEFSRGKSKLVNALLDIDLLPSAQQPTTAINTFLQSPPTGREREKFIQLNFIDSRPLEELDWSNDQVLQEWGTELDTHNKDARLELRHIDAFTPHDLLDKGLVIIDTPGLESIIEHHEAITRTAIAEAYIAIWVQSADQLGGNNREWAFLTDTVRQHFRKFLTVVNKWDMVLEPNDPQDIAMPEAERVKKRLNSVRDNFRIYLKDLPETELAEMTNDQHLMGVSAQWASSKDERQRQRSGIDHLIQRIADLCHSGEAQQEIFYKPLKQLSSIQRTLTTALDDEINALNDTRDIKEQQNELALLDQEIKNQTLDQRQTQNEFRDEHHRVAQVITKQINENLVQPLRALRDELENYLTENYIKREVEAGHTHIGLPADAEKRFQAVNAAVGEHWLQQKQEVESRLNDLRVDYVEALQKHSVKLQESLGRINMDIPDIKIDLKLDLSGVIEYQNKKRELERQLEQREQEIDQYELECAKLSAEDPRLRAAQLAFERAHRNLSDLGSQPAPREYSETVKVSDGGLYSSPEFKPVIQHDYSQVNEYKAHVSEIKADIANREQVLQQFMAKEAEKSQQRQTNEVLRRKAEQHYAKLEKERKAQEQALSQERQAVIAETFRNLKNNIIGELNQRISYLEKNASQIVEQLFDDQLNALLSCVEEQFMQPLRAKQAKREEVLQWLQQSEADVDHRKAELAQAKKELDEVIAFTTGALNN